MSTTQAETAFAQTATPTFTQPHLTNTTVHRGSVLLYGSRRTYRILIVVIV
jgi:hypothetical protein